MNSTSFSRAKKISSYTGSFFSPFLGVDLVSLEGVEYLYPSPQYLHLDVLVRLGVAMRFRPPYEKDRGAFE